MIKQLFCNHENAVAPMKDNTGWTIGEYCTKCYMVKFRKDMPDYETRMLRKIEQEAMAWQG